MSELESHRAQWVAAGVRHYRMDMQVSCFCVPEYTEVVTIEVVDDSIASIVLLGSGLPVQHVAIDSWPTVLGLFDQIEEAIRNGAHELAVSYSDRLGYPDSVYIDREEFAIDEEVGYQIRRLEVLAGR